jgi:WS/DGAT/MGAT family acyltransferase
MPSRERISNVDKAWLRMDRPTNLMQIVGVMLFDGELDFGRLRLAVEQRMLAHRRFVQCAVAEGTGYCWQDDPEFDLGNHLRRVARRGRLGKAGLQRFVADLVSRPLDPGRPLWEMLVVDTDLGGQALVLRIHHSIADGIALVSVVLALADGMEAARDSHRPPLASDYDDDDDHEHDVFWEALWRPIADAVLGSARFALDLRNQYGSLLSSPGQIIGIARAGRDIGVEIAKLALMANDSPTRFKGKPGTRKELAWCEPIPLAEVKGVGKVLGCSVNDLLLAAVAGSLRAYLVSRGDDVTGVEIRVMVPVNLRGPADQDTLGNRFGLVALELPVGIENPLARLFEVRERMAQLKGSYQAGLMLTILGIVGMLPKAIQQAVLDLLANKATAVMTNVPGPTSALYLAGARLRQPLFWVPQSGDIGMGVSILSYDGKVQFGLMTDHKLVPDPQSIVDRFASEFEKFLMLVLMEPWERLGDPDAVAAALAQELP